MSFYKKLSRDFSLLDKFGKDTLSFRMSKYDPAKELEVLIQRNNINKLSIDSQPSRILRTLGSHAIQSITA